jgi:glycosyltransferase involved in cell wall biosynthesis
MSGDVRVVIVAEHASARFGGEAALALHYFRVLRRRNVSAWLVVHERTRSELEALFPQDHDRMIFVSDTALHRAIWRLGRFLPTGLASFTTAFAIRVLTQIAQRRVIRALVNKQGISVIHQPMPVSPKEPSLIYGMRVPVIIGPMNGGMEYPPAFSHMEGTIERIGLLAGRRVASLMNRILPGKEQAALLLVANERTRHALPIRLSQRRIELLVENGVDLSLWSRASRQTHQSNFTRYFFVGRLIPLKGVDLLLQAFKEALKHSPMSLSIIGDDTQRKALEQTARDLGLLNVTYEDRVGTVRFLGWLSQEDCARRLQEADVLVLPSLRECGGAVILEAMAMEIPIIATNWGGPADYIDDSCGILVDPETKEAFIQNLSKALIELAVHPEKRAAMGKAGRAKVVDYFDWEAKVTRILTIYREAVAQFPPS